VFALGINNTIQGEQLRGERLECLPDLYPFEWFWLYCIDLNAAVINTILWCFYKQEVNLSSREAECELQLLINFVVYHSVPSLKDPN
jgi:hypothetical protein